MADLVQQLIDKDGNNIFPIGATSATYDANGRSVDTLIQILDSVIKECNDSVARLNTIISQLSDGTIDLGDVNANGVVLANRRLIFHEDGTVTWAQDKQVFQIDEDTLDGDAVLSR